MSKKKKYVNEMIGHKPDMVNHPPHYKVGGIELIDFLQAKLTPEEFKGFLKGNALKYLSRANHKGEQGEDYKKGQWYLNRLVKTDEDSKKIGDDPYTWPLTNRKSNRK